MLVVARKRIDEHGLIAYPGLATVQQTATESVKMQQLPADESHARSII